MRFLAATVALCLAFCCPHLHAESQVPERPNIVFILIDDMPWYGTSVAMDPSIPGSAMKFVETPNIEHLARQGMIFSNARAAAGVCSPSRCSIQTGMMTAHTLFTGNTKPPRQKAGGGVRYIENTDHRLSEPESQSFIRFPSIGDVMRNAGYTTAHLGKWHIFGGGPALHGYDESDGDTGNREGRWPALEILIQSV
jgi:arylsulfatase A